MPFSYDPQISEVLRAAQQGGEIAPAIERGDWQGLRARTEATMAFVASHATPVHDVQQLDHEVATPDAAVLKMRWYSKGDSRPGSAVVYAHGGGMICGTIDLYDWMMQQYVSSTGVPVLAIDYRVAPNTSGGVLADDVVTGLRWLIDNADELHVDPARIAIMGESGGGGVAAAAAVLARDRGISLAKQILIYPMLDDRNVVPDPALQPLATWTYDSNYTAWSAVLGDRIATEGVAATVAPARLERFADLPPAYLEVGELDIFRDETIAYAHQLLKAGVPTELHVHPGVPHGFDGFAPDAGVSRRAIADRTRVLQTL